MGQDDRRARHRDDIAEMVRRLRATREWTQEELAERLGRDRQFVTRLESGSGVSPTLDLIEDLAEAFDTPAAQLLEPFLRADLRRHRMIPDVGGPALARLQKSQPNHPQVRHAAWERLERVARLLSREQLDTLTTVAEGLSRVPRTLKGGD